MTKDPESARRELLDGFAARGVLPMELERYMGMPFAQVTPEGLVRLRDMLTTLEEGSVTWQEYLDGTTAEDAKDMSDKSQPDTKGKAILDKINTQTQEKGAKSTETGKTTTQAQGQTASVAATAKQAPTSMPAGASPIATGGGNPSSQALPGAKGNLTPTGNLFEGANEKKHESEVNPQPKVLSDQEWADILLYLDEEPSRAKLKKQVREKMGLGNLSRINPTARTGYLLSLQDAAKREDIVIETFIKG